MIQWLMRPLRREEWCRPGAFHVSDKILVKATAYGVSLRENRPGWPGTREWAVWTVLFDENKHPLFSAWQLALDLKVSIDVFYQRLQSHIEQIPQEFRGHLLESRRFVVRLHKSKRYRVVVYQFAETEEERKRVIASIEWGASEGSAKANLLAEIGHAAYRELMDSVWYNTSRIGSN